MYSISKTMSDVEYKGQSQDNTEEDELTLRLSKRRQAAKESYQAQMLQQNKPVQKEGVKPTFRVKIFMQNHPKLQMEDVINFNNADLSLLKKLIKKNSVRNKGRHSNIGLKSQIFIALYYFATNDTMDKMTGILGVPKTTIQEIISRCARDWMPIWTKEFIPQKPPIPARKFANYPSMIGAVDTTTIGINRPHFQKGQTDYTWDAKNHMNGRKLEALVNPDGQAIWLSAKYFARMHDKKIFDTSGIIDFLTYRQGREVNTHGVLADKGYTGITNYVPSAMVMRKAAKGDKAAEEENNNIAADRQIVERWFCRYKTSWNSMHGVYRGNIDELDTVMVGLGALTNLLIQRNPLNEMDDIKTLTSDDDDESPDDDTEERYTPLTERKLCQNIVGIDNQGATCHLNASLQLLYSIPEIRDLVRRLASADISPAVQLNHIFEQLQGSSTDFATTNELTNALGEDDYWLHPQSFEDSFFKLLDAIENNRIKVDPSLPPPQSLFEYQSQNGDHLSKYLLQTQTKETPQKARTILESLQQYDDPKTTNFYNFGRILFVSVTRMKMSEVFPIEQNIDLSSIAANNHKKFNLAAVVAKGPGHFVFFKKNAEDWYEVDDKYCYKCPPDLIDNLCGGTNGASIKYIKKLMGSKWVATFLIYTHEGYNLN